MAILMPVLGAPPSETETAHVIKGGLPERPWSLEEPDHTRAGGRRGFLEVAVHMGLGLEKWELQGQRVFDAEQQ